jgi:hypothetical protein
MIADAHPASDRRTTHDVTPVTDLALVIYCSVGIHDNLLTQFTELVNDGAWHQLQSGPYLRGRIAPSAWVAQA